MPAGRPSSFSDAYCEEAISFMGCGYSLTAFAGEIGVSRETVYEWERTIPEFSDAIKKARAKRVWCLEKRLLKADATKAEVTTSIFALKNACPQEWREKIELDQTVKHEIADYDLSALDSDKITAIVEAINLAKAAYREESPAKANGTRH
ncbi:MAG: hypothetical protein KGL39_04880 [Patescibacteria group bacterium]|nr:hypothetical protein [Patescibacteria group bacterium]